MTLKTTYQNTAQLFHLLSHQGRLQILDHLRRQETCVCHLQAALGRPQAYVSQQLRVLREAGVVGDSKDGFYVYYRLTDPRVAPLLEQVLGPAGPNDPVPGCTCPRCLGEQGTCSGRS
jgi:DNA-binding transcriptional ArsR family regulator